jgi:hypothetical protein
MRRWRYHHHFSKNAVPYLASCRDLLFEKYEAILDSLFSETVGIGLGVVEVLFDRCLHSGSGQNADDGKVSQRTPSRVDRPDGTQDTKRRQGLNLKVSGMTISALVQVLDH